MADITPAQARVLRFLTAHPIWHELLELDLIRLLEDDDVLCIPSLVERNLVEHEVKLRAVRITAAGQVVAGEISVNGG